MSCFTVAYEGPHPRLREIDAWVRAALPGAQIERAVRRVADESVNGCGLPWPRAGRILLATWRVPVWSAEWRVHTSQYVWVGVHDNALCVAPSWCNTAEEQVLAALLAAHLAGVFGSVVAVAS